MRWSFWTLIGFGVWLVLSPWVVGFSDLNLPSWDAIFVGSAVIFLALWNLFRGGEELKRDGFHQDHEKRE